MNEGFVIRRAEFADAPVIAWHRARMFQDMGELPPALFESFRSESERWIGDALKSGEYLGWLASCENSPAVIAGAGVQVRRASPHPLRKSSGEVAIAHGQHAIIVNVFTEPEWRRQGLAARLLQEIIEWARLADIDRLLLHASADGRALYEKLDFVSTNEMRYAGDL
jgi:GNAT superfamily N-acetyltransferase